MSSETEHLKVSFMGRVLICALAAVVLIVVPTSVLAEGFVVYSSWTTQERADSEAAWASSKLGVNAKVKPGTVEGSTVYRVVVEVATGMDGVSFLDSAREAGWEDVWFVQGSDESWNVDATPNQAQQRMAPVAEPIVEADQPTLPIEEAEVTGAEELSSVDSQAPAEEILDAVTAEPAEPEVVEGDNVDANEGGESGAPMVADADATPAADTDVPLADVGALAAEPDDDVPTIEDFAGIDQVTVDQTLLEVEEIQKQAQQMISEWTPRQEQSVYDPLDVLSVNVGSDSDTENQEAAASSGFNVLTLPPRRRR